MNASHIKSLPAMPLSAETEWRSKFIRECAGFSRSHKIEAVTRAAH